MVDEFALSRQKETRAFRVLDGCVPQWLARPPAIVRREPERREHGSYTFTAMMVTTRMGTQEASTLGAVDKPPSGDLVARGFVDGPPWTSFGTRRLLNGTDC